jgi:TonB family protein
MRQPSGGIGGYLAVCMFMLALSPALAQSPPITPPKLVTVVKAALPEGTALPLGARITVVLWVTIGVDGRVSEVSIKEGAGEPFDSAAQAAAQGFVFEPARSGGEPVAVKVPFALHFQGPAQRGPIIVRRRARRALQPVPGYAITGQVLEKGTRSPLAGIVVEFVDQRTKRRYEALTNGKGIFVVHGLPPRPVLMLIDTGEHRVIRAIVQGQSLREGAPPQRMKPVYLDPVGLGRYRTDIQDRREPEAASEVVLTDDELTQVAGTFGDPTRVVATLPGVARSAFGLGYYVVRGANYDNTGFFIDGHPAFFLYHLLGGPGIIHPELIGSLKFYPGGYPVKYGRFGGGAIVLETKEPPDDRWHLDVEIDLLKSSILYSVPFDEGRGQVTASFRRSYYELLLPLFTDDISLSYTDYQFRLKYALTDTLTLRLFALGAEDDLGFKQPGSETDTETTGGFEIGFHRVLLGADWDVSPTLRWTNSTIIEHDRLSSTRMAEGDSDIDYSPSAWVAQALSFVEWDAHETVTVEAGVDVLFADMTGGYQIPTPPPLGDPPPPTFNPVTVSGDFQENVLSAALYAQADWTVLPGWRVLPGVRGTADTYGGITHWTADPKLGTRYEFTPGWTVKGMLGLAHQLPNEFQVGEPFGDPTLQPMEAIQSGLGLEWKNDDGWDISVEGFYNHLHRIPYLSGGLENDAEGDIDRIFWKWDEEGRAYGLELLVRKRMGGRFHGWLSYTLSRAERRRPGGDWDLFRVDQTHVLNLAWTVRLGADWSFGARFTLTNGNPVYPIIGSRYDADADRYQPIFSTTKERLPFYHRLDVRLDKRWRFDTWMLEIYLDIQNVYNVANTESYNYSYDFGKRVPGAGIPILPTLGVRGVF